MQADLEPKKRCVKCHADKPLAEFCKRKASSDGLHYYCRSCDNQRRREHHRTHRDDAAVTMRRWREGPGRKWFLLRGARERALAKGIPFSLTEEDFEIPEFCPVLGMKLAIGTGRGPAPHSPTLDRIDPLRGYVAGNVQVISSRANAMKNDATPEELRQFAAWILKEFPEGSLPGRLF